jgi:hypothetical protein
MLIALLQQQAHAAAVAELWLLGDGSYTLWH